MSIDDALTKTLLEITAIDSPIGDEEELCDHVQARLTASLGADAIRRFSHSLLVRPHRDTGKPRIGLVGHLDTVRTENGPARIEGDRLYGSGAADMKSGLAVMLELVERLDLEALPCELTLVFYEREEGPFEENILGPMFEEYPELSELAMAICLEPSDNRVQLGCMGSVHAFLHFRGRTSHSARPWQGDNALYKAAEFLAELKGHEGRVVEVEGFEFREVITPTLIEGGRARNIVPDHVRVNVNYRFAPGRTPLEVVEELRELVGDRAEVEATDLSPAGHPHRTHPLVQHLGTCGVVAVERKQAWTDVARFDSVGVAAVNFGPGNNAQAHQKHEYTELPLVFEGYAILERFLTTLPA